MPEATVRIALAVLATVFAWAALAKVFRWSSWAEALARYELPTAIARPGLVAVPLGEAAVAILIVIGQETAGAILALVLLMVFTLVVTRFRATHSDAVPCGCFGGTRSRAASTVFLRNLALSLPVGVILSAESRPHLFEGVSAPRGGDVFPALLVLVGLGLCVWMVRLVLYGRRTP